MLGDYPEGMLPQGSNPGGDKPNPRSASGCLKGALVTFPAPGGTNTGGSAPAPKESMHGEHPNGNRPWPTFKPPAEPATPVSKTDRLAKAAASPSPGPGVAALIDIPHPKGEVP